MSSEGKRYCCCFSCLVTASWMKVLTWVWTPSSYKVSEVGFLCRGLSISN